MLAEVAAVSQSAYALIRFVSRFTITIFNTYRVAQKVSHYQII